MRRQIGIATVLVGLALLTTPAFVHSHSSHSGHLGFGLYDESPKEEQNVTVLTEADVKPSVMEKIRSAVNEERPWSVIVHADDIGNPLENALTTSDSTTYVRVDSARYRLRRHYDVGGFFDTEMLIQYGGVFAGIVLLILGVVTVRSSGKTE